MSINNEKELGELETKEVKPGAVSAQEVARGFVTLLKAFKGLRKTQKDDIAGVNGRIHTVTRQIKQLQEKPEPVIPKDQSPQLKKRITTLANRVTELEEIVEGIPTPDSVDGNALVDEAVKRAREIIQTETASISLRDKLEALEGDEKLRSHAVEGAITQEVLDRAISILDQRTQYLINTVSNLKSAPAGSSGTPFYETASGSGTSFSITHSPITGSAKVFGRGQRLAPASYSVSGATITTVDTWSAGDITVDYNY
jgi:hypothetical protein